MLALSVMISFAALLFTACTEENNYITYAPADWQGPVIEWRSAPEAEVRGTVGLDVTVADSSAVAAVRLYVNGRADLTLASPPYRFELVTDSLPDGVHVCEVRAWDEHGNLGISPILRIHVANSVAQGPRVIWVPDEFALIQAAINAAADFDTIRVRDGIYYETLNTFGKGIWIESENGPLRCDINAAGSFSVLTIPGPGNICTIRGFTIQGGEQNLSLYGGGFLRFFNNIVGFDTSYTLLLCSVSGGQIANNLFMGGAFALQIGQFWGRVVNNIFRNATDVALLNAALYANPVFHGYNAFWQNSRNFAGFTPEIGEFEADPLIDLIGGRLLPDSPCINTGDPHIIDLDGTQSDIGPFGGQWAYR